MTPAATGPGSPLIAGVAMSGGDFNDFSDDDLGANNLFDFSNSPDTLQSLESLGAGDPKAFLSPQELTTAPFPDSPNGSYHDSSSESASSKRTGSSTSSKTPATTADVMMDDGDVKMEWGNPEFGPFTDDDAAFTFGREADSALDGIYGFDQDDSFLERSFDFESASSSPETANGVQTSMASPEMPTIKTNSPAKSGATSKRVKTNAQGHHKAPSQYSISSSMNGLKTTGSREVSPMSNIVMSHGGSPAALFNSPSPNAGSDFTRVMNGGLGNAIWSTGLDSAAPTTLDGMPNPLHFGVAMNQSMSIPQQMPMLTPPAYNFTGRYELRILPTPLKSRVETQIPIKMTLTPLPSGVTKLHLPAHTISKPKLLCKPTPDRTPDTLELFVTLVCTSAMDGPDRKKNALERAASHPQGYLPSLDDEENSPQNGGDVRICQGCITRERKRAARKKIKKPDEEKQWSQDEERRVIVFNTQEVKEWQPLSGVMDPTGRPEPLVPNGAMQIDAPMRIACYCRHHGEKMGFNVIFTIKDFRDRVIAQAMSNPIMITDDHKTHPMAQLTSQASIPETSVAAAPVNPQPVDTNLLPTTSNGAFRMSPSSSDLTSIQRSNQATYPASSSGKTTPTGAATRTLSRSASPVLGGPISKKRKASGSRVPNGLTMTRLDTSPSPSSQQTSNQITAATSPFTPNLSAFSQPEALFGQQNGMAPFATGPPTPSSNDQPAFFSNRSASMDNLAMAQLYSAPASNHASRAPSPNGLRNSVSAATQNQFNQLNGALYSLPMGLSQARVPPIIHKIIPNEGPKIGGIEVTVLGAAFFQGLEVWFGEQKATTTTFWGESSLVCLLPPSPVAGAVAVTFKHQAAQAAQAFPMGKQPPIFKYIDDNEDKLIRTALSVLGHKMSGQMVDVSDLARRILNDGGSSGWSGGGSGGGSSSGPSSGGQMFNHAPYAHLESQLLKCLDLIDLDDSTHRTRLDLKRTTGHTMLHLSCSLGYHRFVAALLARGANPDARDKGGFTPLHLAAIHNHPEIVRRLMLHGADPTVRSLSGLSASDVAQSRAVLRAIRRSERHIRSRSSGASLHSRASSATSLRSLWEPLTKVHTHEEPLSADSSEESPEYTSGDFEDEDPDEDSYLRMRRPSGFHQDRPSLLRQTTGELELDDEELVPPTMAPAAALRDQLQQPLQQFQQQLQQFQQSMTLHFQNLPHFPQMPDYQALQLAPFMRAMQQYMPSMPGARPDADGEQTRWWDMTSKNSPTAPPAYEELYPQELLDRKQASAIQAACDAEADVKCAGLYDQSTEVVETKTQVPSVLMIGRKNAITKEQQEQFLAAREEKLKKIGSDRNLFFVWIPTLVIMVCIMLYSYFPSLVPFALAFARSLWQGGIDKTHQLIQQNIPERVVEV